MRSRPNINRVEQVKKESSLPLLLGLISLFGIGYALGSPLIAPHLPTVMERPFMKLHDEINKGLEGPKRMIGLS
jgi:hypothetical protein